ncbi:MAG: pyridoxal phosphate-dependent aminotransferase [Candidatus Latescibacterota bacterium]
MGEAMRFSPYGRASQRPAPVNAMMAAFAADFREECDINLGVGYVDERTIPRDWIGEAVEAVLSQPSRYRLALNYGGPRGSANLVESIRRLHCEVVKDGLTPAVLDDREVIVGASGATSLLEGVARVLEPGIVFTADPTYYIYCHFLERYGYEVIAVPEDDQGLRTDLLEARLASLGSRRREVAFVYVVSVSNPTSTILSNQRRRELVRIVTALSASLGREVPLLVDRAYELLVHDPDVGRLESALLHDEAGVVYEVGTLSKILAPALRIGYLMGAGGPLCAALVQRTCDLGFSAPLLNQEVASHLLDHHGREQLDRVRQGYRCKAVQTRAWIERELGGAVHECRGGQAGLYYYLTFAGVETGEDSAFFRYLARTTGRPEVDGPPCARAPRVVYIPGSFCVHPRGEMVAEGRRQLRLSYGFEEPERIHRALRLMREASRFAAA